MSTVLPWGVQWNTSLTTEFQQERGSMSLADEQVVRDRLDLEMLERPHLWPALRRGMRCVFLKQRPTGNGRRGDTGPCFLQASGVYTVMSHDWSAGSHPKVTPLHYDSAEAVLADGWVVD